MNLKDAPHSPSFSMQQTTWKHFFRHPLAFIALLVIFIFILIAIYAPFLASSQPLAVKYRGHWYFPLFSYLFYPGFYTKKIDIFFNLLIFTFPFFCLSFFLSKKLRKNLFLFLLIFQIGGFVLFILYPPKNPISNPVLGLARQQAIQKQVQLNAQPENWPYPIPSENWAFELRHASPYAKLEWILTHEIQKRQNEKLEKWLPKYRQEFPQQIFPTLWNISEEHENRQIANLKEILLKQYPQYSSQKEKLLVLLNLCHDAPTLGGEACQKRMEAHIKNQGWDSFKIIRSEVFDYEKSQSRLEYLLSRRQWLDKESQKIDVLVMPWLSPFHWENQAGGNQSLNQVIHWWETTRPNRNDLLSALLFGTRISFVVGFMTVMLSLAIGIPTGAYAGYYGGTFDIVMSRMLEIWESMPTFFMLLLVVGMTQTKSIFVTITIIGLFGWTGFCRFTRGEFFKQRNLSYVEACQAIGFKHSRIMFSYILPNAIPPILTLLPFSIMGAIANEAGLSFLGLGEEGSCSWGILMDEGRNAFPSESYLLWPPALFLTFLLIAIAIVGDALRDALDPKMHVAHG